MGIATDIDGKYKPMEAERPLPLYTNRRGLRKKKNRLSNVAFILDFTDDSNNCLQEHAIQRRAIIDKTPGFVEGIVKDFDFEGLGFKRVA